MVATGTRLGPYEILAPLGAGGMGEVYRARDTRLERDVAVKVLPEAFATDVERRARFEREAKAVAALSHPNILAIHDYGEEEGRVFAVMELLEGDSLRQRLKPGPLSWRRALEIGVAIADGLAAAHAKGVIHRDIKPENLFVTSDGRVKILDFGLARTLPLSSPDATTKPYSAAKESEVSVITDPGVILGTVGYMSPEQARGEPLDARSDLFALGCVLYEMLAGQRPFARKSVAETMAAILHDDPPEFTELGKDVPPEVERAVRHCLEKQPEARFHSAHDLAFALRALLSDSTLTRPAPRTTSRAGFWLAAAALLALAAGLAVVWFTRNGAPAGSGSTGTDAPAAGAIDSLAVLPFVNEGKDADADHLSQGIPASIIKNLMEVRDLKVRPYGSAARFFKGRDTDPQEAGRQLQVQAVLTGRVLAGKDGLTIAVELIDVAGNAVLWSESYARGRADLVTLPDELAKKVCAQVRVRLRPEEENRLARLRPENSQAFELYLRGQFHNQRLTEADARKAISFFDKAVAVDPNYAVAYVELAFSYAFLADTYLPPREAAAKGKEAAERALQLNDQLAEAHSALALFQFFYDWDWSAAERSFQHAQQLNPRYSGAHNLYGLYLLARGRNQEAQEALQRAQQLDPFVLIEALDAVQPLIVNRQYDAAIEQVRAAAKLDKNSWLIRSKLGWCYYYKGNYERAAAEFQEAKRLEDNRDVEAGLACAWAKAGKVAEARKVLDKLRALRLRRELYVNPVGLAQISFALGETDDGLAWLDEGVQERTAWMVWLKVDPFYEPVRSDPRFVEILRRVGLIDKAALDAPLDSLAVLPFAATGDDPDSAFLGEGLCISLTNSLAQVRALKVRPLTAVARYRDAKTDALKAARELQVRAVCTGTVQKRGDDLFITVELIDVENNRQLWGQRFRRKFADLFDVQEELAKEIAGKLHLRLTGDDAKRLAKRPTDNLEAYRLYIVGRVEMFKFTEEGAKRAIEYFKKALELDPKYALAYSGLADTYCSMNFQYLSPREALPPAREAARKALELDPLLAEAHTSLAIIQLYHDLDWDGASAGLKRALELNPNYALAQNLYGWHLLLGGRAEEGRSFLKQAVELDPHNVAFAVHLASVDYCSRRHDRVVPQLEKVLALHPKSHMAPSLLGWNYVHLGEFDKAIAAFQKARRLEDDPEVAHALGTADAALGAAYALAGRRKEALEKLDELHALAKRRYVPQFSFAIIHTALGDNDQAMAWLEKAYADRSPLLVYLNVEPLFDRLRSDPRFLDLLRRIGPADRPPRPDQLPGAPGSRSQEKLPVLSFDS